MKYEGLVYVTAALLAGLWVLSPGPTHAARSRNLNVNFNGDRCADLKVRSDGQVAQSAETFTLSRSEAPLLEIQDTTSGGGIRVRGWDRPDYVVEACRIASADDRATAEAILQSVSVVRSAGRFSTAGPITENGEWQLYFIVHAPRDGRLDLETRNGPIDAVGITGSLKVRALNGPIALRDCAGVIEANTTNGPIALDGGGGEVHLIARNGPIALTLTGDFWNGSQLDARTMNGPVSLTLPDTFRSGIRVETDGNSPLACGAEICRTAWTNAAFRPRTLQMNGSQDTIRVSTNNGPVSVSSSRKGRRI